MANDAAEPGSLIEEFEPDTPRKRGIWRMVLGGLFLLFLLAIVAAWFARERIADDLIARQIRNLGLPVTYEIELIAPDRQVLRNIVVGDPARPDLTIERAQVVTRLRWGTPGIGRITLQRPRLFGSYRNGRLSFGSLDSLIFSDSKEPFRLPDLDLAIVDGRGLLESDFGAAGFKIAGMGALRDGFTGIVAAVAPDASGGGCRVAKATAFGRISVIREKPAFKGPLRITGLDCNSRGLRLAHADVDVDATFDPRLDGARAQLDLAASGLGLPGSKLSQADGTLLLSWRAGDIRAHYDITGMNLATPQFAAASLGLEGALRTSGGMARIESDGTLDGQGIALGRGLEDAIAGAEAAGKGTLLAPMLAQVRAALRREGRGSSLAGTFTLRRAGEIVSAVIPQASLKGGSGQTLLALSRFQATVGAIGTPRISGNFSTGGRGLPRLTGRMEQRPGGELVMRARMADYVAGSARFAIPELLVAQAPNGALGFAGEVRLSGPVPGGSAQGLVLPVDGNWSSAHGIALWRRCVEVRFDRLQLADLTIDRHAVPLCPANGTAIVRSGPAGLRVAAGAPSLRLTGRLGGTRVALASGPVGFAIPGVVTARRIDVELGSAQHPSRFAIARLDARIGKDVSGRFEGSGVFLDAVPLDLFETAGDWRYADGELAISNGTFRLEDRNADDRFQPLVARDAGLVLANGRILADALLREPETGREVVRAVIRHDLASGGGDADLIVDGIVFDDALQPDMLTRNALGVIANASGTVRGRGHVDWRGLATVSTGTFSTDRLDFAAAFGPVTGASGQIVFTDLLGLETAPGQVLHLATINPGIEVYDGVITYQLLPDSVLAVRGGTWPFLGGKLLLEPTRLQLGVAETRRFTLVIEGLEAAKLIGQMELANLSANGTFDGVMPLVFDEHGGRVENGLLQSRPPGGNLSYVGELTYEDLSAMANFAFDALKSLDYRQMKINLDGSLEGEIVTRVTFDGISQGEGTSNNLVTRQIAKLPIRFNVNIRAPFFQLATSLRSIYDPAYVRDPRELGLVDERKGRLAPARPRRTLDELPIQPPESDGVP